MRTEQENNVLNHLIRWFNLPEIGYNKTELDYYEMKRDLTKEGFIGTEVPYRYSKEFIHWTDFVLYIPNLFDIRIEVKTLNSKSDGNGLSILPSADVTRMNNIPEKYMIYLLEGEGFGEEAFRMFQTNKQTYTFAVRNVDALIKLIMKLKGK